MKKGDIVLVPFPFTHLSGNKNRPAIILYASLDDVTVCFVTTQLKYQSEFDVLIQPSDLNGLKKHSVVKLNKIATIDKSLLIGLLGKLDDHYIQLINKNLIKLLNLAD